MRARLPRFGGTLAMLLLCLGLGLGASPARAQQPGFSLTLSDLKTLFVDQQQYFVLDNEATADGSLNHLHITSLDTKTGLFEGVIWAPVIPPYIVPHIALEVVGTIAISPTGTPLGSAYGITFNWSYIGSPCPPGSGVGENFEVPMYAGAILFQGFEGSGKMHATIAGTVSPGYGDCKLQLKAVLGPYPFSGRLVK